MIQSPAQDPASYDGIAPRHPIGDIVDGIFYLERATFVTGETPRVDGGWAAGH